VDALGLRQVRVIIRSRQWSSGKIQTGTAIVTDLELSPRPHVRGVSGDPSLNVGPITPAYVGPPAGGYTVAQINPSDAPGFEWNYVIVGPDGVERPYKLQRLTTASSMRYMLDLEALDRKVPF
jgi:hypothetical protein